MQMEIVLALGDASMAFGRGPGRGISKGGVIKGVSCWCGAVPAHVFFAFTANQDRAVPWCRRRKRVENDVFDPLGIVTRTATVEIPLARVGEWVVGARFRGRIRVALV